MNLHCQHGFPPLPYILFAMDSEMIREETTNDVVVIYAADSYSLAKESHLLTTSG